MDPPAAAERHLTGLTVAAAIFAAAAGSRLPAQGLQASVDLHRTTESIHLDGRLVEPAWLTADSVTSFTQLDPDEGAPATERTVVRLLDTPTGLAIGFWGYDRDPAAIRHAQLRRDADFGSDDFFTVVLAPELDRRSGYVFRVNPNGALADAEIIGRDDANLDWDGIWDARAAITPEGWTAELLIPWQTLRYPRDQSRWGLNFQRYIRRTNEEALWQGWHRQQGLLFQDAEGTLEGVGELPGRRRLELRPYAATEATLAERSFGPGGGDSVVTPGDIDPKVGGDAKLGLGQTLTLDLTANTDFAQVEADRQVINLTRFPLFFPEKRPFFLEGGGTFDFGQSGRTQMFYTRRIGLADDGTPIPLLAGARLQGRAGRERLGLLAVRTGGAEDAWDLVGRVQHDVLSRGHVGAIATAQDAAGPARLGGGLDFELPFVAGGQNLVLAGFGAGTRDRPDGPTSTAWRLFVDYPNDWADGFFAVSRIEAGFDPALGFVLENGIWRHTGGLEVFPRPHRLGIRRLSFKPMEWDVNHRLGGGLSHASYQVKPLGVEFESGDEVAVLLERVIDVPQTPFDLFPGSTVAPGRYQYDRALVVATSSPGRPIGLSVEASAGEFYDGTSTEVSGELTVRVAPHLVFATEYSRQAVDRPMGGFVARAIRLRTDLSATPRLGGSVFLQWENESDRLTVNARVHWILRPGSDIYLAWNTAWPTGLAAGIPWSHPEHGALIVKVVSLLRL
jgi:uncharacterized protein DUF5916